MVRPLKDEEVWPISYGGLVDFVLVGDQGGGEGDVVVRRMELAILVGGADAQGHRP